MIGIGAIGIVVVRMINDDFKRQREKILNEVKDFSPNRYIVDEFGIQLIAVNYQNNQIRIINQNHKTKEYKSEEFKVRDLISFEIEENGKVVSRVSNKSMLGRAAVGGVLFGGVGAVIGGVTAKQKSGGQDGDSVTIKLIVDDLDDPVRRFEVKPSSYTHEKKVVLYKSIFEEVEKWSVIINKILDKEGMEVEAE